MAILAKKIHLLKSGGSEQTVNVYSTTTEVGSNYIFLNIDGIAGYAAIGSTSDSLATAGRVTKNGTTYALKQSAEIPYAKITYTTTGTHTFKVPAGVTKVKLTVAGAGGGGSAATEKRLYSNKGGYIGSTYRAGYAGGTGGLYTGTVTVTSGTTYSIQVGAGGAGGSGSGASGKAGGNSTFGSLATATGGSGGTSSAIGASGTPAGSGGAGGAGAAKDPYICYPGSSGSPGWVYVEYGQGIQ